MSYKSNSWFSIRSDNEIIEYSRKYPDQRERVLEYLLNRNDKLLWKIVWRYKPLIEKCDLDSRDLFMEAQSGMICAFDKFDLDKGVKFSTYSYYWILQFVKRYVELNNGIIKLPAHVVRNINLLSNFGTIEKTLQNTNLSEKAVKKAEIAKNIKIESFDILFEADLESDVNFEDSILGEIENNIVLSLVNALDEPQKSVIESNFGFFGDNFSRNVVKEKWNLTEGAFRKILRVALLELKDKIGKNQ